MEAVLRPTGPWSWQGLAGLSALTWAYPPHPSLADAASGHGHGDASHAGLGATEVLLTCVMWAVMMVVMMTPSAAPMILTFATLNRRRQAQRGHSCPPGSSCWAICSSGVPSASWPLVCSGTPAHRHCPP